MALTQPQLDGTGDPGGLWVRLGILFKMIEDNRLAQITTLDADTTAILEQLVDDAANIEDLDLLPTVERNIYDHRASRDGWNKQVANLAKDLTLEQVNATDTLYATSEAVVLDTLLRLMNDHASGGDDGDASYVFERPTITFGAHVAHYNNVGDGQINVDHYNKGGLDDNIAQSRGAIEYNTESSAGLHFSYIREEDIDFVITSKSSSDKGTMTKFGFPVRGDRGNYKWPGGSGSGTTIKVCDQKTDAPSASVATGANVLQNSDFEDWTGAIPDQWEVVADAGLITEETTNKYEGVSGIKFLGTGSGGENPQLKQKFIDSDNGTISALKANTKYCVQFYYYTNAASLTGSGDFEVRVKVGDHEAAYKKDLTSGSFPTTFTRFSFFFNTPPTLPAQGDTYAIFIGIVGGDLGSGDTFYVDFLGMCECKEQGNLFYAAFNGITDFKLDDRITVPITSAGVHGGGSEGKFQFYMDLAYGLWEKGTLFRDATGGASGIEVVPDSLI